VTQDDPQQVRLAPGVVIDADMLRFRFVASAGPGGQNVNKRATKAELRVVIDDLPITAGAKLRLAQLAGQRATDAGELIIVSERHRSQRRNRDDCVDRLSRLVAHAITPPKPRRPTRPTRSSIRRRLDAKRQRSETKQRRRPPQD
jgi:ribosome-associated protein